MLAPEDTPLSVVVAEPNDLLRAGLCATLANDPRFLVAGDTGGHPIPLLRQHQPHLLILDADPAADGWIAPIEAAVESAPQTRICVYARSIGVRYLVAAVHAGADCYLAKGHAGPAALVDLLALLARDGLRAVEPWVVEEIRSWHLRQPPPAPAPVHLTKRERAVLDALLSGASDKAIAGQLDMACSTVRTHVSRLQAKFDAASRSQLAAQAIRVGAVTA